MKKISQLERIKCIDKRNQRLKTPLNNLLNLPSYLCFGDQSKIEEKENNLFLIFFKGAAFIQRKKKSINIFFTSNAYDTRRFGL